MKDSGSEDLSPGTKQDDDILVGLEDAMRAEFFSGSPQAQLNSNAGIEDQVVEELSTRFPHTFRRPTKAENSLLDDPRRMNNLLQGLGNMHAATTARNQTQVGTLQNIIQQIQQAPLNERDQASVESIMHSIRDTQTSLDYGQQQMASLIPMLGSITKLLSGDTLTKAFDPNISQTERMDRVMSVFGELRSTPGLDQGVSEASGVGLLGLAPLMNQLDAFMGDIRQMHTNAENSFLPNLADNEEFQYQNLTKPTTIRLLQFLEQGDNPPNPNSIKLSMEEVDLDAKPSFSALSYVWGDHRPPLNQAFSKKRSERCFHILCNGYKIAVTYNLFCCLRQLANAVDGPLKDVRKVPLWIDQLCINQEDGEEKAKQVAMMGRIYSETQTVVSWLGEKDSRTDAAMQLLETLKNVRKSRLSQPIFDVAKFVDEIPKDDWLALGAFLSRPYFKRAWIVQEIALAGRPMILCGDQVIKWNDLVECSEFLEESRAWMVLSQYASVFRSREEHMSLGRWRPPSRFGGQLSAILSARETIRNQAISAESLLLLGRQFDASKTVDKFYAMLGMASLRLSNSASPQLPAVDYKHSVKHVALEFSKYHIESSRGLGILSMVEDSSHRSKDNLDFPSWLFDPTSPLLPYPLETYAPSSKTDISWSAGGSLTADRAPFVDGETLVLQGFQIGVVGRGAEPFNKLSESDEWFRLFEFLGQIGNAAFGGMKLGEALWRTLTTVPEPPAGKSPARTPDLSREFGDWCVSLITSIQHLSRTMNEPMTAEMMSSAYRLDDTKFDLLAFGRDAADIVRGEDGPASDALRSTELTYDSWDKRNVESKTKDRGKLARQMRDSLYELWKSNSGDIFPSPVYVREITEVLNPFKSDSPGRKEVQDRIDRFNVALGMKLDSRRLFTTTEGHLGIGPQSLAEGDGIWVLSGADVPFVLRKLDQGVFRLVGEGFLFGAMHGEAMRDIHCSLREVRLV
jgi:hypothetical protein